MIGDKCWIKGEDCVGMFGLWLIVVDNFRTPLSQQSNQCIMFLLCNLRIWSSGIVPGYRVIYCKGIFRAFYKHSAKRCDHALATEGSGHFLYSLLLVKRSVLEIFYYAFRFQAQAYTYLFREFLLHLPSGFRFAVVAFG